MCLLIVAYFGVREKPVDLSIEATYSLWEAIELDRITAYNAVEAQTDSDPHISSCGTNIPKQVAVSQDILFQTGNKRDMCGREVAIVLEDGTIVYGVVWDTMNARYKKTADILVDNHQEALEWGVKKGLLIMY